MRIISHHFSQNTCDTDGSQTQPYMIVKKTRGFLFVSPGPTKANKKKIKQPSARTEQNGSPPKPVLRQANARSKSSSSHDKRYNQGAQKKKQTTTHARTHARTHTHTQLPATKGELKQHPQKKSQQPAAQMRKPKNPKNNTSHKQKTEEENERHMFVHKPGGGAEEHTREKRESDQRREKNETRGVYGGV
jgi:hypothetical protein